MSSPCLLSPRRSRRGHRLNHLVRADDIHGRSAGNPLLAGASGRVHLLRDLSFLARAIDFEFPFADTLARTIAARG